MESGRGKQAKNRVCPRDEGEEKVGKKVALLLPLLPIGLDAWAFLPPSSPQGSKFRKRARVREVASKAKTTALLLFACLSFSLVLYWLRCPGQWGEERGESYRVMYVR